MRRLLKARGWNRGARGLRQQKGIDMTAKMKLQNSAVQKIIWMPALMLLVATAMTFSRHEGSRSATY